MYKYGVGGNEVKIDANEAIVEIPSNRTLFVQKLTDEAPISPEIEHGLETIEDVFERFNPTVTIEHLDQEGNEIREELAFKSLGDFGAKSLKSNSAFLSQLDVTREQLLKMTRQLSSNRALLKAVGDKDVKEALIEALETALAEITKSNPENE